MHFPTPYPQYHLKCILLILILSISVSPSLSNPRISQAGLICATSRLSGPNFIPNFTQLMGKLKDIVFKQRWGRVDSVSSPSPALNAFAQCHEDLSQTDCNVCFSVARGKLSTCLPSSSGRVVLDGCFVRFRNETVADGPFDPETDTVKCSPATGVLKERVMRVEFENKLKMVIENVTETALMNDGFGVAEVKGGVTCVYALAQCWKTVNDIQCSECLKDAKKVLKCAPGSEGRVMNAGCFLRYSTDKFFGAEAESHCTSKLPIIIGSVLGAIAITLLLIFGAFMGYKRLSEKRKEQNNLSWVSARINKSSLSFKYETLEKATDFFNSSNKLGQGGAGSVFKGSLPDGKIVAVKRLFYSTRQWVDEFFNEVNLISGVQHKNLVKLLGCSIEGPESLLVYEYVSNGSLDQFINDKTNTQTLSWQQRVGIIFGTADGLAYLHGGSASPVKIIHRDIKGSNILLDENLTPKIADFGLVRCLAADKSHISTGIAGTLGYMAPEYLVRGQLTEKADVYAFGVLVLEIVCGRKNTVFSGGSSSVLQSVWKHYKSNRLPETVDPSLKGDFPAQEASNVLQIGLLCTQASAALRPSMSEVFQMLNDEAAIPTPKQPPFLNSSVLGVDHTTKSFAVTKLSLNGDTPDEGASSHSISIGATCPEGSSTESDGLTTADQGSPSAACPEPNGLSEKEKTQQS